MVNAESMLDATLEQEIIRLIAENRKKQARRVGELEKEKRDAEEAINVQHAAYTQELEAKETQIAELKAELEAKKTQIAELGFFEELRPEVTRLKALTKAQSESIAAYETRINELSECEKRNQELNAHLEKAQETETRLRRKRKRDQEIVDELNARISKHLEREKSDQEIIAELKAKQQEYEASAKIMDDMLAMLKRARPNNDE